MPIDFTFWGIQTILMLLTALIIPGLKVSGPIPALVTVIVMAYINSKVWDAALFLKVPDSFSIHAVMLLVVNGLIFWVVVKLLPGIEVEGILPALAAPVVFSLCSLFLGRYMNQIDWAAVWKQTLDIFEVLKSYFVAPKGKETSLLSVYQASAHV